MFLIDCPWCGKREQREFTCSGEAGTARPPEPEAVDDAVWADYLFARKNTKGLYHERWVHTHGCGRWLVLARDTANDAILAVYRPGGDPPDTAS